MSRKHKSHRNRKPALALPRVPPPAPRVEEKYEQARQCARKGQLEEAGGLYENLAAGASDPRLRALALNDRAALLALGGDLAAALGGFREALAVDAGCEPARLNLALVEADLARPVPATAPAASDRAAPSTATLTRPVKVAILSFLFNWPSTGGGIVHTVELARFLSRAGHDVRHFYARHDPWGIGRVEGVPPTPGEALVFDEGSWNVPLIQARFRRAVDAFAPDYVLITDSWNMKPLLAEAMGGYRVLLRLQAMECLCPLNNLRLLPGPGGTTRQCALNLLATQTDCARCLQEHGALSGGLHQAERALCGADSADHHARLLRAFGEAEAVLVVNNMTAELVRPYARSVRVVTAGMDPARFPWPPPGGAPDQDRAVKTILFAGLVEEWIKGFHVLRQACALLRKKRRDFELVATGEPAGPADGFTRHVGWQSQEDLPRLLWAADLVVLPTVAQEALGRTAVEAMAAGRPVVASRLGGLPETVLDGVTGLLVEPGNADELAAALERLLDDPGLRQQMGLAGRRRFEEHYDWNVIIERHYQPLLSSHRPLAPAAAAPPYAPHIPEKVDRDRLLGDVAEFFEMPRARAEFLFQSYQGVHEARGYARSLGEYKTLCFEEAYVLYVLLCRLRPATLVVLGAEDGRAARRLLDARALLGLEGRAVCFDRVDRVRHYDRREAELVVRDLTGRLRQEVLEAFPPGLLYLDVHTYPLLREALRESLAGAPRWAVALHDCGRGLCNPRMELDTNDPNVTSLTGLWERHVLAEAFGVADPLDRRLDRLETPGHRLRIFDTPHGLAVILPR
jgi:glycosyltransferase involved in cell wall biosynthesis